VSAGLEAGLYKNDVLIDVTNEVGDNLLAKSFKWIKDNETLEEEEYKIVLDADITVNTGFSIGTGPTGSSTGNADKNKNITITLQGLTTTRTITMDGKSALFTVYGKDATDVPHLILDENITLKGYSNNNSALVVIGDINKTGKLTMMAGSRITGNTTTTTGGGVYVLGGGTFDMEGGSIDNNQTTNSGGGVYADTFTMSGGSIENNSAGTTTSPGSGGGVYAGTFTMSGGVIKNNNCVELNDGVAAENFSNAFGGGVYVGGTFTMSGNAEISDNSAEIGGGVVVPLSTFDMQGGTIAKNRASIAGAAVAVSEYANKFSKSGGIIYGVTGTNANKSADGIGANVHSIAIYSSYNDYWEYEPSAKFYYDDTANTGTALDSTQTGTNWIAVP
jgi:predicted outer membrane repeat protein